MSSINKKLDALAQKQALSGDLPPLKMAQIKPVAQSVWPSRIAVALCAMGVFASGWIIRSSYIDADESGAGFHVVTPAVAASNPVSNHQVTVKVKSDSLPVLHSQELKTSSEENNEITAEHRSISTAAIAQVEEPKTTPIKLKHQALKPVVEEYDSAPEPEFESESEVHIAQVRSAPRHVVEESHEPEQLSIKTVTLNNRQLADLEYNRAEKALAQADSQQAIISLQKAVKYRPDWIEARQKLAATLYGQGSVRGAIATLEEGLELAPQQPVLRLTLAKLLVQESQPEAALAILNSVPANAPMPYLVMRGALAQEVKNNAIALNSYQQLLNRQPQNGRWWLGLAIAAERSNNKAKATMAYQQALKYGHISQQSIQFAQQRLALLTKTRG
ncbi:tetratricopeptide repeat protein [Photobacterium damselae subsp. damselae]|uniref:tetratricopeptide repeat protein n=1 Tax=Photobacterium damselae TaxID=38293 RepID=UPI001F453B34|nr:tetratricopeptide repeat protein [Photobacterium damselae]UKA21677.1 tetratricopeptide repeat protein [Photobacterium damselae subsp. damselae]